MCKVCANYYSIHKFMITRNKLDAVKCESAKNVESERRCEKMKYLFDIILVVGMSIS